MRILQWNPPHNLTRSPDNSIFDQVCTFESGASYWFIVLALALSLVTLGLSLFAALQASACKTNMQWATLVASGGC